MLRPRLIALLLAFATLLVFLPVVGFGFVNYDDPNYVTENSYVKNGLTLTDLQWAFTTFHASNWHPLTWISLMTDCTLFGLNPGAAHLVNVLFHAANTALLFGLLWRLTRKVLPSAFVAALFAWHPLHVESVAWISERKDVLSTFCALLSLLAYAQFVDLSKVRDARSKIFYLATLIFFALGLMSKPMVVTLPFVMLLLDFWPLGRISAAASKSQIANLTRLVLEKTPFFLLTVPACVVTCLAQRSAMMTLEKVALPLRLENALVAYPRYLLKLVWPVNLAVFYPLTTPSTLEILAALAVLGVITVLAWQSRRAFPQVLVGWLWFLGTLVPVIGIVQVGGQAMADRYSYLPSVGIFILVAFVGSDLMSRFRFAKKIVPVAAILMLIGCVAVTENQLRYWSTSETLWSHTLDVTQNNEIAHINLGTVYEKQGRTDAAMREYLEALKINPRRANTYNNIGNLLDQSGRPAGALADYQIALRLDPSAIEVHLNLGVVLAELGHFDEAALQFQTASKLQPTDARPHFEWARALLKQGHDAAAVDELRRALQLDPQNVRMLTFAARVLASDKNAAGRNGRAALDYATRANGLTGGQLPMALDALSMAYAETGDFSNAQTCVQKALDLMAGVPETNVAPLQKQLELYKNRQPWRESFATTNAAAQ